MKVTTYVGSLPHFLHHAYPIHQALPDEIRGPLMGRGRAVVRGHELGLDIEEAVPRKAEMVMTASYEDARAVNPSPVILVNHGVGMRYSDAPDHPSYSGGRDRSRVQLHLCPSERDAEVCRRDGARAVAVGVGYLDRLMGQTQRRHDPPVVAWTHHADIHINSETRWAFPEYQDVLKELGKRDDLPFQLVGHCHPRMLAFMRRFYPRAGIPFVEHFPDVIEQADILVVDNSSVAYEWAALGRPVVLLNASYYRRDVHHNLRFWSHVPGLQVDRPEDVLDTIVRAIEDPPEARRLREEAVSHAYAGADGCSLIDGRTVDRAVAAVVELVNGR